MYSSGYGSVIYNDCYYGTTRWVWNRYGSWYDPWGCGGGYGYYDPFYSGYGYGYSGGGYSSSTTYSTPRSTGSVRLKIKPKGAKVYVDGTLMGVADDFDGLTGHLMLDAGTHQIELRADGYETFTGTINIELGKTTTERISLKKK